MSTNGLPSMTIDVGELPAARSFPSVSAHSQILSRVLGGHGQNAHRGMPARTSSCICCRVESVWKLIGVPLSVPTSSRTPASYSFLMLVNSGVIRAGSITTPEISELVRLQDRVANVCIEFGRRERPEPRIVDQHRPTIRLDTDRLNDRRRHHPRATRHELLQQLRVVSTDVVLDRVLTVAIFIRILASPSP